VVEFPRNETDGDLHLHAPLNAVLRFGKAGERLVPVKLGARLTEVGRSKSGGFESERARWRLQFELRKAAAAQASSRPAAVISDEALAAAEALIPATFAAGTLDPQPLPAKLEQTLGWDEIRGRSRPSGSWRIACWSWWMDESAARHTNCGG